MTTPATILNDYILARIAEDLLGRGPRHETVIDEQPRSAFPAGNLGPEPEDLQNQAGDFRVTEYNPYTVGLLATLRPTKDAPMVVEGSFNVFYAVAPTLAELRDLARRHEDPIFERINWSSPSANDLAELENTQVKYRPRYVRKSVQFRAGIRLADLALDNEYHSLGELPATFTEELRKISDEAHQHSATMKCTDGTPAKAPDTLSGKALLGETELRDALKEYTRTTRPEWRADVRYRAWQRPGEDLIHLEILLLNALKEKKSREQPKHHETHLFDPRLRVIMPADVLVFVHLRAIQEKNYRNDPFSPAIGINCDTASRVEAATITIATDSFPVHSQRRFKSRRLAAYGTAGAPTFNELEADPIPHLERVAANMETYAQEWDGSYTSRVASGELASGKEAEFQAALGEYRQEIVRFRQGIQTLRTNAELLLAFRLTNRTFANRGGKITAWRLFQLVFIVSNMPDFLARASQSHPRPRPFVLWFPTGGGKTEAYLGLSVAHAFWDRLRGKTFGVTAWFKFPLRLLSMQQFGRVAAIVEHANIVRMQASEIPSSKKGEPFSVGLHAGGGNSTNFTDFPPDASKTTQHSFETQDIRDNTSGKARVIEKNHKIDRCEMCASKGHARPGTVVTTFDETIPGFRHACGQCGHKYNLHVTDTETFRFLPTIVIGTIDKLAQLGREPVTKVFFGYAKRKCETHGYLLHPSDSCPVLSCGKPLAMVENCVDASPSLLIQDELHFLRETLGAFDSHYETMTLAIMERASLDMPGRHGGAWKIVGSTATIEGFEEQVAQVYGLEGAVRYPVQGPTRAGHFYAEEDSNDIQRLIVGFRPHHMSHVDAVMKVLLSFHRTTLPLAYGNPSAWAAAPATLASLTQSAREELMTRYRTSLTYALSKVECAQVNRSFVSQLNPILRAAGLPTFAEERVRNLTGETDSTDVQKALYELEDPPADRWYQAVTATSVISHGVDLEVLNFMVFRGQPNTTSEWIQAMSRVGRGPGIPSIVVNVYNPNRERDATHYRHHKKYVEHADSLVRVVPVTRFSTSALRRTAPGLFYNALAYFCAPPKAHVYFRNQVARMMATLRTEVTTLLLRYYRIPSTGGTPKQVRMREALEARIEEMLQILNDPSQPEKTLDALRPMTSLRDVDEAVTVMPSYDAARFSPRRR